MDYVFNAPWWLLAMLLVVGGLFAWGGFSRKDRTLGVIGVVMLVIGIGLVVVSRVVETDKEQIVRRSVEIVAAVEAKDWPKFESYMDPNVTATVSVSVVNRQYQNRDQILADAKKYLDRAGSVRLSVQQNEPADDGPLLRTDLSIYATGDQFTQPTTWRFHWKKQGTTWLVRQIDLTQVGIGPGR